MNANLAETPSDYGRELILRLKKAADELAACAEEIQNETALGGSIPIPPRPKREIVGQLCSGATDALAAADILKNQYA